MPVSGGANARRPLAQQQLAAGAHKYVGPADFANGLYNADVLTIGQEPGDLGSPVATGATGGQRRALCSVVLAAYESVGCRCCGLVRA